MKKNLILTAKKTILQEAKTLENLAGTINDSFVKIVHLLFECSGRIIITGIGKSALVGQKIVATLNSTGSRAIYMHAGDAAHGDLGMVAVNDIVICLSKSGQTAELKVIIPLLKSQGTKIVAICSEKNSYLYDKCDFAIHIPIDEEAEPNNLIPTSSTSAQMAIGDAIAICLLSLRGFTPKDFALLHPGGSLGKQLFLKVVDLQSQQNCPSVTPTSNIRTTILEMTSKRMGATAVLNDNKLLGIITDGDLRRMLQKQKDLSHLQAKDIMTLDPICIQANTLAFEAFQMMKEKSISQIIIMEDDSYQGMIHLHDFLKEGFV